MKPIRKKKKTRANKAVKSKIMPFQVTRSPRVKLDREDTKPVVVCIYPHKCPYVGIYIYIYIYMYISATDERKMIECEKNHSLVRCCEQV